MQEEQIDITIQNILKKYKQYWNSALKKVIQVRQYLAKRCL